MTTDFVYGEFIMLSDDSFVSFSVKDDQAEIRPPLDSLNINVSLHLNVNITVKQAVQTAALGAAVAFTWFGIPPSALAQTKELASSQQSQIAYMGNTEVPIKSMHSAPISTHSENCSISDVATVEKVDSNSTNSSAEETSLNVVNPKSKKSNTIKKKNKDSLLKSTGKNQEKTNSAKGLLKYGKIIAVGSMEFTNLVFEQPPANQPAGQQLKQASPNVGPDGLQPHEQRLAEEVTILSDVTLHSSQKGLQKASNDTGYAIRHLNTDSEYFKAEQKGFRTGGALVVENTVTSLTSIRQQFADDPNKILTLTSKKTIALARESERAWKSGETFAGRAVGRVQVVLKYLEPLPAFLNRTSGMIDLLRTSINSRINIAHNATLTHKHEHFGKAVHGMVVQDVREPVGSPHRLAVIYNLFEPQEFLNNENPVIRYHNGTLPQKLVLGIIADQNYSQARELAGDLSQTISKLPDRLIHDAIQSALVSQDIGEVVPGANPRDLTLELPESPRSSKMKRFPVKVWSDSSNLRVPTDKLDPIHTVATVIMDKVDIHYPAPVSVSDNPVVVVNNNVNNSALKSNLLIATRLKVGTEIPHVSGLVQADLFNLNHYNAPLKDRLFVGGSVDLLGAVGAKNYQPWLIEVSAQKSVLSSAYRISLNVGCELGF